MPAPPRNGQPVYVICFNSISKVDVRAAYKLLGIKLIPI